MSIEEFGKTHGLDLSDIINARTPLRDFSFKYAFF